MTMPKPSKRELTAKIERLATPRPGARAPISATSLVQAPLAYQALELGPLPARRRRSAAASRAARAATGANAAINRSKPFWRFSRPAATITGASSAESRRRGDRALGMCSTRGAPPSSAS